MIRVCTVAAALAVCLGGTAMAADYKVQMKTLGSNGAVMVYEPNFLAVQPGDTVTFQPTDPGHDVASVEGMIPEGAQPFKGKLNEEVKVTFTQPGVYGYECTPHYSMGMVGVVLVGPRPAANLAQVQAVEQPAKPKAAFDELLKQAAQP